ncbi:Crp/Fnr family transcriptional regulator, partial [Acidobacteriota bacterium]
GFYLVRTGEIRVFKMDEQGKEIEIVRLGPGDYLGEAIVFTSTVYPVYAQAVKDSEVVYFPKKDILDEIEKNPSVGRFFIQLLAKKCVTLNKRIESLGLQTVRQRLIRFLLTQSRAQNSTRIELHSKKGELARILGTINETLSRNLKQLQDEGLIEVDSNFITINDIDSLRLEV